MNEPIPFRGPALPILGQPFTLKNFFVTVQIVCNCAGKEPVLLVGNGQARCPACARTFQQQGFGIDPNGQPQLRIGVVLDEPVTPGVQS